MFIAAVARVDTKNALRAGCSPVLQRDVAVPLPKRNTCCIAKQSDIFAVDTIGAQTGAIGSYDSQVSI